MPSYDPGIPSYCCRSTDAVQSRLEQYFENPSAENVFRDARGAFKRVPVAVISKAFVAGWHPPEFKVKVESKLEMKGHLEGQA